MKIYCTTMGAIFCAFLAFASSASADTEASIRASLVRKEMSLDQRRMPVEVNEASAPRIPCVLDAREKSGGVALKKCLDLALDAPAGSLIYIKVPQGIYSITGTVECRSRDGVGITIEGPEREIHQDKLAVFLAVPELGNEVLFDSRCSNLNMRYLAFHGNKMKRDYRRPIQGEEDGKLATYVLCDAGGWRPANIFLQGFFINLKLVDTTDAPCGSGIGIRAIQSTFYYVRSMRNGFEPPKIVNGAEVLAGPGLSFQYGDGFTVLVCVRCVFVGNEALENSDIGFAFGGGTGNIVRANRCEQLQTRALACISVGRFGGDLINPETGQSYDGYHKDSRFEFNIVVILKGLAPYGYTAGAWFYCRYEETWCKEVVVHHAGTSSQNRIQGAKVLAGVSGVEAGEFLEFFLGEPESEGPDYFIACDIKKKFVVAKVKPAVRITDPHEKYDVDIGSCRRP